MSEIYQLPVTGPSAWKARDFETNQSWIREFTADELDELHTATLTLKATGKGPEEFGPDDFPLPAFSRTIAEIHNELAEGRGFVLLRGIDVDRYDQETLELMFWGFQAHLGTIISQNSQGDLLGYVTDRGENYELGSHYENNIRGHRTRSELNPHTDTCDVVGLLCVRPAKSGGTSSICSSMAIYNECQTQHPEFIDPLTNGFHFDLIGKGSKEIEYTETRIPVFSFHQGYLSCRFNKRQIELGMERSGKGLTDLEQAAIDYVRELSVREDFLLHMDFRPGDIQLLNNHVALHARNEYEDWPEAERKRLLLRVWINVPNGRPLAPNFANRLNSGDRGGVAKRA
ncbi:MAG: TauD/TfdA family dioxygenase [Rhodospirillaceae bacterium]|jgi:hypothetical protein|nr:TauD/TfdA family dioxygenase [Rhodospirillales bacterium]MBT3904171.1 TauD/TfdA family dioxygenase [Rhodospirillaceae bacterium]MBT4701937.1 TauD/TfdA family dioxygenase [Rhodospirillaceae bacterium]MBT5035429.1 TauD/TfdA family dioxygenase [Rhodospirillaceae bacterium]MBT6218571.1 TauD/TfdA family dioxygenase [Rhodospirillaceae bacterium]